MTQKSKVDTVSKYAIVARKICGMRQNAAAPTDAEEQLSEFSTQQCARRTWP